MANKFQLIDIIDESQKVTQENMGGLLKRLEESENSIRKTLGIRAHMNEMDFDFDSGSDPGEDEDDFRHSASQGAFDDEEGMDDEMGMGDEEGMEDPHGMGDEMSMGDEEGMGGEDEMGMEDPHGMNMSDEEARDQHPDKYADMAKFYDDEEGMGEPDEFDSEGGDKFDADEFMSRHFGESENKKPSLLQTIALQVTEMSGQNASPKRITPRRNDIFIKEDKSFGRFMKRVKKGYEVKMDENMITLGLSNIKPATNDEDADIRRLTKSFKTKHPKRNLWVEI